MYLIVLELISNYFPEEGLSCARFKYLKSQKQSVKCVWTQLTTCQKDIYEGLKKGVKQKKSPVGCIVLDQIIKNAEIADAEDRPYCQDTGMTMVFLKVVKMFISLVVILQKLSMLVLQLVMLKVIFVIRCMLNHCSIVKITK